MMQNDDGNVIVPGGYSNIYAPRSTLNFLDIDIPRGNVTSDEYKGAVASFLSNTLTVPLIQDATGAHYKPLVDIGSTLKEGDPIALSTGSDSSCLFSPVPGVVKGFCDVDLPIGIKSPAITIELSGQFSYLGKKLARKDSSSYSLQSLKDSIEHFGVLNTFKALTPHLLSADIDKFETCNTVVVRLFGEDNSVITDTLIANYYFQNVISGSVFLAKALSAKNIIFACDKTTHNGVKSSYKYFSKELAQYKSTYPTALSLDLAPIDTKYYPSGNRSALTHQLKKLSFLKGDETAIFIDSGVALTLYETLSFDMGVTATYIVVSGDAIRHTTFMKVRLGTTFRDIVRMTGGFIEPCAAVIVNGFITGGAVITLDTPVTKSMKSLYFASGAVLCDQTASDCIHCGKCRAVCPKRLAVDKVFDAITDRRDGVFAKSAIFCDDCGLCNLVCPARRPLCQVISRINHG